MPKTVCSRTPRAGRLEHDHRARRRRRRCPGAQGAAARRPSAHGNPVDTSAQRV